jgi:hypothetical protein
LWPVAVCHKTGDKKIGVWMSAITLVKLTQALTPGGSLNLHSKVYDLDHPIRIEYADWLMLLENYSE